MSKIVIDPITRIEGHLKVEVETDANRVVRAKCSADMYRGLEKALIGYDYLTAIHITQRTCGCCPYAHAEAAALAIEDALKIELNKNGKLLRNLVIGAYKLKDYILHFYTLSSLDFIDISAILKYSGNSTNMNDLKNWVKKELRSNKVFPSAIFLQRYKAAYLESKELNLVLINHYLEAFEVMKNIDTMVKIFGGKSPHMVAIEAGGVTTRPTAERLVEYISLTKKAKEFIYEKYLPDVIEVAKAFKEYFHIGKGSNNFLTFNTLLNLDDSYEFIEGFSKEFKLEESIDPYEIVEYHDYAYYKKDGGFKPLELDNLEPLSLEEFESTDKKYSWSKAPRYKGNVVEVGPAAIVINTYLSGKNRKLNTIVDRVNKELGITIKDYNSVMGRHLSRAIISCLIIDKLENDVFSVDEGVLGFIQLPKTPSNVRGVGLTEATRGALAHFIDIGENGFIRNYEMVVPTTWNISPRDNKDLPGALEMMLTGTKIKDKKNPIEVTRVVRSIDPCLACAVH
ncbi:nickel-dependent hydrogenase large subunit [Hydrogenimonas thermophila]|uniref:nickel-dependent hydrogenase large subunit n=1 Tax=Hydrogenimonas thermophila TaxID=223786 RepID=UPI002936FBF6|nr:nickel-dependent hydrogenase large subunit [Hydrogenimonas thermophila]WOE69221.1 nickel-dependent hydrogenase large subunit [Hydrogenimonas thermophila]WOE71731.1 nickel-dependent hydrogenase large subunit [Hydrogenimonas thermophila]